MDFKDILGVIKPTKKEEQQLARAVKQVIRKIQISHAKPVLGGSGAKQTWLRNTHDVDIYVKFDPRYYVGQSNQIADVLHGALKKKFPSIKRLHGSRDYFQTQHRNYAFEIVPILNISKPEQAQNTTDFSQLHVEYVLRYVRKKKSLADEIRLVKQFAKANHVYGAESYIKGFSGYVLELLIIHHGSFMNLMKAAAKWKSKAVIGDKRMAKRLNPSKISPLIVIDPVQPGRNAAAALSEEKFYDFIMAVRAFLKHQSLSFFREKHLDPEKLRKLGTLVQLNVKPLSGNRDIVGAKLLKAFAFIREQLRHHDFTLITAKWSFNPVKKVATFYYVLDKHTLPPKKTMPGPPLANAKAVHAFKEKHGAITIKEKRAYAIVQRQFQKASDLINHIIKRPEIKERAKAISIKRYV